VVGRGLLSPLALLGREVERVEAGAECTEGELDLPLAQLHDVEAESVPRLQELAASLESPLVRLETGVGSGGAVRPRGSRAAPTTKGGP